MHPTLAHDGEAFIWARRIGLPLGLTKQIVVHLKGTANVLEGLSPQQIDEWRVGEEYRKATLDEELTAKANRLLLGVGIATPFGAALARI